MVENHIFWLIIFCFLTTMTIYLSLSVTRFGEILPLWLKFTSLWQICKGLFLIWQNAEPILANLWHFWANFLYCKWPNIENNLTIWSHCLPLPFPFEYICHFDSFRFNRRSNHSDRPYWREWMYLLKSLQMAGWMWLTFWAQIEGSSSLIRPLWPMDDNIFTKCLISIFVIFQQPI